MFDHSINVFLSDSSLIHSDVHFPTGTNIATLNISRLGSYGRVQIDWQIGFEGDNLPAGYTLGSLSPASGSASLGNGVDSYTFTVQVSVRDSTSCCNLAAIQVLRNIVFQ